MRIVKSGEIEIRIRASALALLYYQQEFGEEIMHAAMVCVAKVIATHNLLRGQKVEAGFDSLDLSTLDISALDWEAIVAPGVDVYRLCWAMAKAQAKAEGKTLPNFEAWLESVEGAKVRDIQVGVISEAVEGFFR